MDTIAPTIERIAQAAFGIDAPEIGQRVDRRAYAIRDIFADLRRRGQISDEEMAAGRRFAEHLEKAYRGRSITPSYGQRFAEGTPVSQLAGAAADADNARVIDYVRLHMDARDSLPPSSRMAIMLACESTTPAAIGRMVAAYRDSNRAAAAGVAYIKSGLEILAHHYGIRRSGEP